MSERIHSTENTPVEGPTVGETTPATRPANSRRKTFAWLAVGTVAVAVTAVGAFQVWKQGNLSAQPAAEQLTPEQMAQKLAQLHQRPVARVGKQVVTYNMVAEECFVRHGEEILDSIVNRLMIHQACQERGLEVSNAEVDAEVMKIAQKFNLTPENWYSMLKAERNLSPLQYRRDVIWPMLALKKLAGDTVDATNEDLQKAFETSYGPRVQARMIMVDQMKVATEVWSQAQQNPEEFERLAQKYSIEPNSKALGGTIPPIRQHVGNPTLITAAFKLRKGEVSPVINLGPRMVILKCEGHTDPIVKQMTPEIRQELYNMIIEEKTQEAVANIFEQLKQQVRVDNYLKDTTTGGVQQASSQQPAATSPRPAGTQLPGGNQVQRAAATTTTQQPAPVRQ